MSLIVVDIQPEYKSYIPFLNEWVAYINKTKQKITFLYNGHETLGMVTESDYQDWLVDIGVDEEVVYNATFYDKGYAFFRYCMDIGTDNDEIVGLVKFMHQSGVNDTRDLDDAFWDEYVAQNGSKDLRETMQHSQDCINIPDLMDFLQGYNNITLCGGGINECLKEVEIALDALNKKYKVLTQYVYQKGGRTLKTGGGVSEKTFLQLNSHRARAKFSKMNIPHETFVSTKTWNHYTVVATKDVDKILDYVKKSVKVVKAKINPDDLVRPWKEQGGEVGFENKLFDNLQKHSYERGGVANFKVQNYEPFKYTIGGL